MESVVQSPILSSVFSDFLIGYIEELDEHPWFFACVGSILVGLSGILPLLIIKIDETASFNDGAGAATLRILLSFSVGGLLGDVFLHVLPEAWHHDMANTKEGEHIPMKCGLWCLFGMLVFIIVEKLFAADHDDDDDDDGDEAKTESDEKSKAKPESKQRNGSIKQIEIEEIDKLLDIERKQRLKHSDKLEGAAQLPACSGDVTAQQIYESCLFNNNTLEGCCNSPSANGPVRCAMGNRWLGRCLLREARDKAQSANKNNAQQTHTKHVAGYLNLMANSIDNFTHGLAVGGSFLVGFRVGVLTTFAILVHEIPHEVGDFAILLKSGFSRWEAAKAQLATASAGLIGAMTAVIFSGAKNALEAKTSWIAPFTAGGFLHIALVTVLPALLKERDRWESLKHLAALAAGIALMALMTHYSH